MVIEFAEIIRALAHFAWPTVVIVIAFGYKPELKSFIPTMLRRKLKFRSPSGHELEIEAAEQQQKMVEAKIDFSSGKIELKEIPGLVRTAAIEKLELELHSHLKSINETEQVDILVRNLAQARLEAAFGLIYASIFGSQIIGLKHLEARRKVTSEEAYKFYLEVQKRFPEIYESYGFIGWIGFLKNHCLINHVKEDIVITDAGDDFLQWLQAKKLSINRPW